MHQFITISNEQCNVVLSIGIDIYKNYTLYMPSLTFKKDETHVDLFEDIYWDNPRFIFGDLKIFLEKYISNEDVSEEEYFEEIFPFIEVKENAKELLEMLELAIQQNWDKTEL
jgi:hypothetical protein